MPLPCSRNYPEEITWFTLLPVFKRSDTVSVHLREQLYYKTPMDYCTCDQGVSSLNFLCWYDVLKMPIHGSLLEAI